MKRKYTRKNPGKKVDTDKVIGIIAGKLEIETGRIKRRNGDRLGRKIAIYIFKVHLKMSLDEVKSILDIKSNSSIYPNIRKIKELIEARRDIELTVNAIIDEIRAQTSNPSAITETADTKVIDTQPTNEQIMNRLTKAVAEVFLGANLLSKDADIQLEIHRAKQVILYLLFTDYSNIHSFEVAMSSGVSKEEMASAIGLISIDLRDDTFVELSEKISEVRGLLRK